MKYLCSAISMQETAWYHDLTRTHSSSSCLFPACVLLFSCGHDGYPKHQRKENAISWLCVFLATKLCLLGNSSPWALGILWYVAKRQEKRYEVDTTSKSAVLGGVDLPHHPKIPFSQERNGIQYTQLVPGPAFLLPMSNWQDCRLVSWNPAKTAVCLMDQALVEKQLFFC